MKLKLLKIMSVYFITVISCHIMALPDSRFTASRFIAGTNVYVEFAYQSKENKALTLTWDFGDGTPIVSNKKIVKHKYNTPGTYKVILTVDDSEKSRSTSKKEIVIKKNKAPEAKLNILGEGHEVNKMLMVVSKSLDEDGEIVRHIWKINGEEKSNENERRLIETFRKAGNHTVSLQVEDDLGAISKVKSSFKVLEKNINPTVQIKYSPSDLVVGKNVKFTAVANDSDGKVVKYLWKLGSNDKFKELGREFSYNCGSKGQHFVVLKVIDDRGGEAIVKKQFVVMDNKSPKLKILTKRTQFHINKRIRFRSKYEKHLGEPLTVKWDFGKGDISSEINTLHIFKEPGIYNIKLNFVFKGNVKSSTSKKIVVIDPNKNLLGVAQQAVIFEHGYIELSPNEAEYLQLYIFDSQGNTATYSNVLWSSSDTNVISFQDNTVEDPKIIAGTTGSAFVKATVDGIESQNIEIKVKPYVNNMSVVKKGRFFGASNSEFKVKVNVAKGSNYFNITSNRSDSVGSAYASSEDSKVIYSPTVNIEGSVNSSKFFVERVDTQQEWSGEELNINTFLGRNGYLYYNTTQASESDILGITDDRVFDFDDSFSISVWLKESKNGFNVSGPNLITTGNYQIEIDNTEIKIKSFQGEFIQKLPSIFDGIESWHFITLTYNSTLREVSSYKDGTLIGKKLIPDSPQVGQSDRFYITNADDGFTSSGASLDELRIWNKTLTESEVKAEMFTPALSTSSDLLSTFSFDYSGSQIIPSENNSSWYLMLGETEFLDEGEPIIIESSKLLLSQSLVSTIDNHLEFSLLDSLGEGVKGSLSILSGTFDENPTQIQISQSDCKGACESEDENYLHSKRLSSYIKIDHTNKLSANKYFSLKIPFNSQDQRISDTSLVKVGYMYFPISSIPVFYHLEPFEVNLEKGYVEVRALNLGYYWVTFASDFEEKIEEYDNVDLSGVLLSTTGSKMYHVALEASESTYQLKNTGYTSDPSLVVLECDGINLTNQFSGFPHTLTGLSDGSYCYLMYEYQSVYYFKDLIMFSQQ